MKPRRLVLVIMIDALGHRVVEESSFLEGLARKPRPVRTVLGFSSSAIPSLLTGAMPQEHGHFAMFLRNTAGSPFRGSRWMIRVVGEWLGREGFLKRRLTRQLLRQGTTGYFSLYEIPSRLFPEWDLCQKRNLFRPDAIPGYPTLFDHMHERGIPYRVWDWSVSEESAWAELREAVGQGTSSVLFLYSSSLDSLMHFQGTRSDATREKLRELDALIRSLVAEGERIYGDVRFFIFGDHGMTDVTASHDMWSLLPEIGPPGKRGALYFLDSTMARFWFDSPRDRERIEEILSGLTYGRSLSLKEEKDLGVHFADRRYGDLIFVLEEGHILVPSFMGRTTMTGMHGYHPDEGDSSTTLLTNTDVESPEDIRGLAALLKEEALGSVER